MGGGPVSGYLVWKGRGCFFAHCNFQKCRSYSEIAYVTYHRFPLALQWVEEIGGHEQLTEKLLKRKKGEELPTFIPPKVFDTKATQSSVSAYRLAYYLQ